MPTSTRTDAGPAPSSLTRLVPHATLELGATEYGCEDSILTRKEREAIERHLAKGCGDCSKLVERSRRHWPAVAKLLPEAFARRSVWAPGEYGAAPRKRS